MSTLGTLALIFLGWACAELGLEITHRLGRRGHAR